MAAARGRGGRPKAGTTQTVKAAGKKPISFKAGGLHESTGTPQGQPIPAAKMQQALSGKLGPKAAAQARLAKNVLTGPKKGAGKSAGKGK